MPPRPRSLDNFGTRYYLTDGKVTTEEWGWSLELVDHGQMALVLGVSSNQVYMWRQRTIRNGFPDPVALKPSSSSRKRGRELWLKDEVVGWKMGYRPSKGGRPRAGD